MVPDVWLWINSELDVPCPGRTLLRLASLLCQSCDRNVDFSCTCFHDMTDTCEMFVCALYMMFFSDSKKIALCVFQTLWPLQNMNKKLTIPQALSTCLPPGVQMNSPTHMIPQKQIWSTIQLLLKVVSMERSSVFTTHVCVFGMGSMALGVPV